MEYREEEEASREKVLFHNRFANKKGQAVEVVEYKMRRWKIENEGFNTQKKQGYNLEHR